ncbi:squalene synthetase-like protein [Microbotryomycetes sp. JL201]|nr:squalene synthetase-like protein [Microbotryomycetes sp. JL201]
MAPRGQRGGGGRGGQRGGRGAHGSRGRGKSAFQGQGHVLGSAILDDIAALSSSARGSSRGRGARVTQSPRGGFARGRGGGYSNGVDRRDYSELSFDYGDLNSLDLGIDSVTQLQSAPSTFVGPTAKQQRQRQQQQPLQQTARDDTLATSAPLQDNETPSGAATPHFGIGASRTGPPKPRAGLGANRQLQDTVANGSSMYTSKYRHGNDNVIGMGGKSYSHRPLLVPVAFVKASELTPSLDADLKHIDDDKEEPGELEDKLLEGQLVNDVNGLALNDEMAISEEEAQPSFVIDTVGETPHSPHKAEEGTPIVMLGNDSRKPTSDSSDDDDEEIVFRPQSQARASVVVQDAIVSTNSAIIESHTMTATVQPVEAEGAAESDELTLPRPDKTRPNAKLGPAPKLSKSQKAALKKAGKKARKQGKTHVRSGNQHLIVSDDSEDETGHVLGQTNNDSDLDEGRAMFDRMKQDGVMNVDSDLSAGDGDESQVRIPRQGDSDLDWGSDGPPSTSLGAKTQRLSGQEKKAERRKQRSEQRERDRLDRLSQNARAHVNQATRRSDEKKQVAIDDYVKNVLDMTDEDLQNMGVSLNQAQQFVKGMMGADAGVHKTLQDLEDADESDDDIEAWQTDSGSGTEEQDSDESNSTSDDEFDSDDELERDHNLGEADALVELALEAGSNDDAVLSADYLDSSISSGEEDAILQAALMSGKTIRLSSMGKSGPGGRRDRKERHRARKGKGRAVNFDLDSDDDDDDDEALMFSGQTTWDNDMMAVVDDVIDSRDRKARNKLFKAISEGDFESFADDYNDFSFAASKPKGKGKNKVKPSFGGDFASDLEEQWAKDRQKKSVYKRERAAARAAEQALGNHGKKARNGKKAMRTDDADAGESDAQIVNIQIRQFLMHNLDDEELALPPMSKKSRVAVHLLAEVYGLKSKSVGKGARRFPVLERTNKSSVFGVDERKIRAILGTARGDKENHRIGRTTGKMGGLWAALNGEGGGARKSRGGGGAGGARHSEGAVVGQGADRLGEDNIGFALLKRMGWTEGQKIGTGAGGLAEPIPARIKTSKSGLGSGYAVTMSEAYKMARSSDL